MNLVSKGDVTLIVMHDLWIIYGSYNGQWAYCLICLQEIDDTRHLYKCYTNLYIKWNMFSLIVTNSIAYRIIDALSHSFFHISNGTCLR